MGATEVNRPRWPSSWRIYCERTSKSRKRKRKRKRSLDCCSSGRDSRLGGPGIVARGRLWWGQKKRACKYQREAFYSGSKIPSIEN